MSIFDAGYLFFLLPAAVSLFVLIPRDLRPWGTAVIGAALLWFLEPDWMPLLLISAAVDYGACLIAARWGPRITAVLPILAAALKDLAMLGRFCIWGPLFLGARPPAGLAVVHLSLLFILIGVCRGNRAALDPAAFAAYIFLPGRLTAGPFILQGRCQRILGARQVSPAAVLEGACAVAVGAAEYVLLARPLWKISGSFSPAGGGDACVAGGWLAALVPAMAFWITCMAVSDTAWGTGRFFGLRIPAVSRIPAGARSAAEHVWRLNMPLTETLGSSCFLGYHRRESTLRSTLVAAAAPFLLALLPGYSAGLEAWALWLSACCLGERVLSLLPLPRIPNRLAAFLTLACLLPGYVFLPGLGHGLEALPLLIGRGGVPFFETGFLYLCGSNALPLAASLILCTGLPAAVSRWLRRAYPKVWLACAAAVSAPLLVLTASFLIRK